MANRAVTASRNTKSGDNFKVAVRVRPLIERELKTGLPCVSPVKWAELKLVPGW